jgi:hypothetical protein
MDQEAQGGEILKDVPQPRAPQANFNGEIWMDEVVDREEEVKIQAPRWRFNG